MTSAENTPKDPEMEIPKELPKRFFDDLQDFIAKTFEPQYITHKVNASLPPQQLN